MDFRTEYQHKKFSKLRRYSLCSLDLQQKMHRSDKENAINLIIIHQCQLNSYREQIRTVLQEANNTFIENENNRKSLSRVESKENQDVIQDSIEKQDERNRKRRNIITPEPEDRMSKKYKDCNKVIDLTIDEHSNTEENNYGNDEIKEIFEMKATDLYESQISLSADDADSIDLNVEENSNIVFEPHEEYARIDLTIEENRTENAEQDAIMKSPPEKSPKNFANFTIESNNKKKNFVIKMEVESPKLRRSKRVSVSKRCDEYSYEF